MTVRQDLHVRQGETWSFTHTHSASLTGYSARMSVRTAFSDGSLAYLTTGPDADGGTIAIDDTAITLSMTDAESTNLMTNELYPLLPQSRGPVERFETLIYDLEVVSPAGAVTRLLEGHLVFERGATT